MLSWEYGKIYCNTVRGNFGSIVYLKKHEFQKLMSNLRKLSVYKSKR